MRDMRKAGEEDDWKNTTRGRERIMLYNDMVLPYFNYCSITWATADQKHLDVLERLLKRAGRMVLGVPSRTNTREV